MMKGIRIPQRHIADSVADRIVAIENKLNANSVQAQGIKLEQALAQPVGDVAPLPGIDEALAARALDL